MVLPFSLEVIAVILFNSFSDVTFAFFLVGGQFCLSWKFFLAFQTADTSIKTRSRNVTQFFGLRIHSIKYAYWQIWMAWNNNLYPVSTLLLVCVLHHLIFPLVSALLSLLNPYPEQNPICAPVFTLTPSTNPFHYRVATLTMSTISLQRYIHCYHFLNCSAAVKLSVVVDMVVECCKPDVGAMHMFGSLSATCAWCTARLICKSWIVCCSGDHNPCLYIWRLIHT